MVLICCYDGSFGMLPLLLDAALLACLIVLPLLWVRLLMWLLCGLDDVWFDVVMSWRFC